MYKDNKLDFNYEERFNKTLNILKNKEVETDIHISDFIEKNYKNYRLFNYHIDLEYTCCNHPSNILLIECTSQILHLLGKNSITYDGPELIPGNYYVTQYDINFFKYNWIKEESPEAFDYYKNIITKMYNIC